MFFRIVYSAQCIGYGEKWLEEMICPLRKLLKGRYQRGFDVRELHHFVRRYCERQSSIKEEV